MNGHVKQDLGRNLAALAQMEQIWDPLWQQNIQKLCHPSKSAAHSSCKSGRLEKAVVSAVRYNMCVCVCTRWQNCWTLTLGLFRNELSIVGLIVRWGKAIGVKVKQAGRKTESSVIRPLITWGIHTHKTRIKHSKVEVGLLQGWFQICMSHFWHTGLGMSSKLYIITKISL